jgi:hypothetical protein
MQQFQSDLAGYLPERGILSRAPAIPMRMASDGIALLGAMPLADRWWSAASCGFCHRQP